MERALRGRRIRLSSRAFENDRRACFDLRTVFAECEEARLGRRAGRGAGVRVGVPACAVVLRGLLAALDLKRGVLACAVVVREPSSRA